MKIVETKHGVTVKYNKTKDKDITWRRVKEFCQDKMNELDNSKEHDEIISIKRTIMILEKKVELFEKRRNKYQRMYNLIHDTDKDIDEPFIKEKENDE